MYLHFQITLLVIFLFFGYCSFCLHHFYDVVVAVAVILFLSLSAAAFNMISLLFRILLMYRCGSYFVVYVDVDTDRFARLCSKKKALYGHTERNGKRNAEPYKEY